MTDAHPIVARLYDPVMAIPERTMLVPHREYLTEDLSGRVLDLGAGTGALFPYLGEAEGVDVHAIEPDPYMREQAREKAESVGLTVALSDAEAESLPYEASSFDVVVASFVFCTIPDPAAALSEVARVLRGNGEFRFVEHVRGDGMTGRVHDAATPLWHAAAGGCHLNRETGTLFREDDRFDLVDYREFSGGFLPMIRGRLRRRSDASGLRRVLVGLGP